MNQPYSSMALNFEREKNTKAALLTSGVAGVILLLLLLMKLELPEFFPPVPETAVEVELNLGDEGFIDGSGVGGGGGGNPELAAGPKGTYANVPITPTSSEEDAKDIETDDKDVASPAILKPTNPKPTATKVNDNSKTIVKKDADKPAPVPAPPKPKAVVGKTLSGSNDGGGNISSTYPGPGGGRGNGNGTGNGDGIGTGNNGGIGSGSNGGVGGGVGPRVTRGDRKIVKSYTFKGELDRATIYADVRVSPDGIGTFIQFAKGSGFTTSEYRNAITEYLRNIRFDKSDHTSTVTVQFNFRLAGG